MCSLNQFIHEKCFSFLFYIPFFWKNVYYINQLLPMLLGIWLALCQQVPGLNSLGLGALVYTNGFTTNAIHEYGESSLGFPCVVFLGKKRKSMIQQENIPVDS
jgi:hypothetical protein